MENVCEKAKDRVDKLEEQERRLNLCFKYLICPKCGNDVEKIDKSDREIVSVVHLFFYGCSNCDWSAYRST